MRSRCSTWPWHAALVACAISSADCARPAAPEPAVPQVAAIPVAPLAPLPSPPPGPRWPPRPIPSAPSAETPPLATSTPRPRRSRRAPETSRLNARARGLTARSAHGKADPAHRSRRRASVPKVSRPRQGRAHPGRGTPPWPLPAPVPSGAWRRRGRGGGRRGQGGRARTRRPVGGVLAVPALLRRGPASRPEARRKSLARPRRIAHRQRRPRDHRDVDAGRRRGRPLRGPRGRPPVPCAQGPGRRFGWTWASTQATSWCRSRTRCCTPMRSARRSARLGLPWSSVMRRSSRRTPTRAARWSCAFARGRRARSWKSPRRARRASPMSTSRAACSASTGPRSSQSRASARPRETTFAYAIHFEARR